MKLKTAIFLIIMMSICGSNVTFACGGCGGDKSALTLENKQNNIK